MARRSVMAAAFAMLIAGSTLHAAEVERWKLEDLYANAAAWDADAKRLEAQFGVIAACRGHLGDAARRLAECLDLNAALSERLDRLQVYASLLGDEDTRQAAPLELRQRAELLASRLATAAPYQALAARMNRLMDEIEAIVARPAR